MGSSMSIEEVTDIIEIARQQPLSNESMMIIAMIQDVYGRENSYFRVSTAYFAGMVMGIRRERKRRKEKE